MPTFHATQSAFPRLPDVRYIERENVLGAARPSRRVPKNCRVRLPFPNTIGLERHGSVRLQFGSSRVGCDKSQRQADANWAGSRLSTRTRDRRSPEMIGEAQMRRVDAFFIRVAPLVLANSPSYFFLSVSPNVMGFAADPTEPQPSTLSVASLLFKSG